MTTPPLPGFAAALQERATASTQAAGAALTLQFRQPLPSINATSAAIEKHAPLFRDSPANPQSSLFPPPPCTHPDFLQLVASAGDDGRDLYGY